VGWGHPKWVEPSDVGPDERGPEGGEAKDGGIHIKLYEARTPVTVMNLIKRNCLSLNP